MNGELSQVSNKEFRTVLDSQIPRKLDEELKIGIDAFYDFTSFIRQEFQTGIPQPRYSVTPVCMKSVLKNVRILGKPQYVMDSGNLKIIRLKGKMIENKITETFPFVSKNFNLDFLDSSEDSMTIELAHFSKFPIERKYIRQSSRDIFG